MGNPCDPATGNKYQSETDFTSASTGLTFTRNYNSLQQQDGVLGFGWTGLVDKRLELYNTNTLIQVREGSGRGFPFEKQTDGSWKADGDTNETLTETTAGFTLTYRDGSTETYDPSGKLLTQVDSNGKTVSYTYDSNDHVSTITGPFGHSLGFTYNTAGKLTQMTDPSGQQYGYTYDSNNNLTKVTYPDGTSKTYHYENTAFPHHLTGITDENGQRFATYGYDANGKATSTEHAGGQGKMSLSYTSATQTTVTDSIGTIENLTFAENLGVKNLLSRIHSTDTKGTTQTFDANNNRTSVIDEKGTKTVFTYNAANQLLSQTEAQGTTEERKTAYTYVSNQIDLPTSITRPSVSAGNNQTTSITYDTKLNPTQITQSGYTPTGTATSRTVSMSYNSLGQVTSINGPRTDVTDVTAFTYYSCSSGNECGQLKTITNAKGHVTTFNSYDANGRVTEQTDANNLKTLYSYDLRGRVIGLMQQVGATTRLTQFGYTAAGQLKTATFPDGLVLTYAYNAAQELTSITDSLGNKVTYAYDTKGNRISTQTFDPTNTLVRKIEQSFDIRNRLNTINAAGSITKLVFSAVGNLSTTTDPKNNPASQNSYDGLNRLTQNINRLASSTTYQYNTNDQLTKVVAPNSATTSYTTDDLGNRLSETSPDRGNTSYQYNTAGQVISLTDARGITVAYSYDALGRITKADYPGTSEDISYVYDSCTNGKTRLCISTDQSGTTSYQYDAYGNITNQAQTVLGNTYVTQYSYDSRDRIKTLTYPDTRTVAYTRDTLGRITQVTSTLNGVLSTLLSNRAYRADGLPTSQTFGNGLTETRTYDLQGRLTQTVRGINTVTYQYDANGNVTSIQNAAHNPSYAFDAEDRVTGDNSVLAQIAYAYDPNANRSSITKDGKAKAYSYNPNTNQLIQVKNKAYTLDAAGNTISLDNGKWTFSYNHQGRLFKLYKEGKLKATYLYNAQGQRIIKTVKDQTTVYLYDQQGNLINEIKIKPKKDPEYQRAYVWVGTTPITQIKTKTKKKTGATQDKETYYLHTDHLNTPRQATNATGTDVWRWDSDAFGKQKPNNDPDGDGKKVKVNLRFPGQYYDKESKLFYNWNRYYSPKLGRYVTSDPIGLEGGLNTYGYVGGNPLSFTDPMGLVSAQCKKPKSLQSTECMQEVMDSIPFVPGPGRVKAVSKLGSNIVRICRTKAREFIGRPFPTKLNRGGKPQPFDPKTGRFLKNSDNPGFRKSPAVDFTSGLGEGFIGGLPGGPVFPPAATKARSYGRLVGKILSGTFNVPK